MSKATEQYGNDSISQLKGADRVRKRPGVIFGSDDIEGCIHGFFEILSNSTDEAKTGHGDRIEVIRYMDGSIQVTDHGRGVPMDWNETEKRYNHELVFEELYAGGKYNDTNYEYSLGLNGIMLISSVNDFTTMMENTPSDYTYALYLPTYAADAWYHGRLAPKYQEMKLEDFLEEVRAFAGGEYLSALFAGRRLDDGRRDEVATRIAAYSGLDKQEILKANLRVLYWDFCEKLLSDRRLVVGRIDGRYTGPLTGGSMADGDADPSAAALGDVFGMAVNRYINDELGFHTDRPYEPLSLEVNEKWTYPASETSGFCQEKIIYESMSKNSFLKIWVLCGYYDMATPFFAAEWTYDHVFLNKEYEKNLTFTYYPSGHMIYMHEPSLAKFREQAQKWYKL